jgi:hypothetical protein
MHPTIVVTAYNRPLALRRLLSALEKASYPQNGGVRLHISIDRSGDPENQRVCEIAGSFSWPYGEKLVVYQPEHLGLLKHFFHSGNLALDYGAIIQLEDDLLVSPAFYAYAAQALGFYDSDDRIAGVSLYSLWFNGYTHYPFVPFLDASDTFFLQIPYTQGQAFTGAQWQRFVDWHNSGNRQVKPGDPLHELFLHFDAEDWFPIRTKYLVETDRYYAFPRQSLATGFGDAGTHFSRASYFFQVPLQNFLTNYRLNTFDESIAVYDSFFEMLPSRLDRWVDAFHGFAYSIDLNGTKSLRHLPGEYVLSSRPCKSPLQSFGKSMWPVEANLIERVPGKEIFFCKKENLLWGKLDDLIVQKSNYDYYTRRHPVGRRLQLKLFLLEQLRRLRLVD